MEGNKVEMARNRLGNILTPQLIWFVVLPGLPLILGVILLQVLVTPTSDIAFFPFAMGYASSVFLSPPEGIPILLGNIFTYVSVSVFHTIVCGSAIGFFIHHLYQRRIIMTLRMLGFIVCGLIFSMLLVLFLSTFANQLILIELGYKWVCFMLEGAGLEIIFGENSVDCIAGTHRLTWMAWIPSFFGIGAVVFAAAFAYAVATKDPDLAHAEEWESNFLDRVRAIQRGFYVLSLVLVSSTITIMLFTSLPLGVLAGEPDAFAGIVKSYSSGATVYWGTIFTLTLGATFAPAVYCLLQNAQQHEGDDASDMIHEHVFVSSKQQLGNVLALFAPLMIGPAGSILGNFSGVI
jgi:hypothetical protein